MQQSVVIWKKSKRIFPLKNVLIRMLTAHPISIKTRVNFLGMLKFCGGKECFGFKKLLEVVWTLVFVFHRSMKWFHAVASFVNR